MASGRIVDYLGYGTAAARPASLSLTTSAIGIYYATDTNALSVWDGTAWVAPTLSGSVAWGSITGTLSSQTDLNTALNGKLSSSILSVNTLTISTGVVNIDCSLGDYFTLSLTANVTSITFSNLPATGKAQSIMIRMQQDATGGRTVALPSSFKAISGSDTTVQSPANAYTILAITSFDQGTRWEYSMKAGAT